MDDTAEIKALYEQIQQIYQSFRQIRGEAEGILETSDMPDSQSQLGDVLQSTEEATLAIITHVSSIQGIISETSLPDDTKNAVGEHVTQVFEACSFQDISGQRINKVMSRLQVLEEQLKRLSNAAKETVQHAGEEVAAEAPAASKSKDPLLNGPQLSKDTPNQDEVNKLFDS